MSSRPETDEEWAEHLRKEVAEVAGDTEAEHYYADCVLIEFLRAKGYTELLVAWEAVPKWYA